MIQTAEQIIKNVRASPLSERERFFEFIEFEKINRRDKPLPLHLYFVKLKFALNI